MQTDPAVRNRVQIVPLGFEYARLKAPILRWKADVVVAVEHSESDREIHYVAEMLADLEANERIELDRRSCDLFELYDALGTITEAIADYDGDDVHVNLSAGSKITAIAGMIACMASGASPLYARPDYGPDGERIPDRPLHDEVAEVFELPTYPIDRPPAVHVEFLAHVRDETADATSGRYRGVSKKELIEFAIDREFPFVARSTASSRKGYYRLLDRHVLDPLAEDELVEIEKVGRRKFVSLTPAGADTLRAFRHVVDGE